MQQDIPSRRVGQVVVARVQGLELLHEDSRGALLRAVADNPGCDMVLNCEDITYVSSSGLGAVFSLHTQLRRAGRRLILVSLQPSLLEVLQMTRTDKLLTVVPDEETAFRMLAGQTTPAPATGESVPRHT